MKVWIYCYAEQHQLDKRETKMLKFASERRMEVIEISKVTPQEETCLTDILKEITKVRGDGIIIYNMEELPLEDRMLLIDYIHQRKITIFCCKYAGKEVV